MKSILRKWFLGTSLNNEYVCIAGGLLSNPLKVLLMRDDEAVDITDIHVLLSYQPLVIGLAIADPGIAAWVNGRSLIRLSFRSASEDEVAWLELKRMNEWRIAEVNLIVCLGHRAKHRFLSNFFQLTNRVYESLRSLKPRDGALSTRLYDQVRIAYAVPRSVSIISVGAGDRCNLFPTDLHGAVGEKFYIGSLRIGGKACEQVQRYKRIVISRVSADSFQEAYALGKNHMSDLKEVTIFDTSGESEMWRLPLPRSVVSYKELNWKNSFDVGLHRIHFYEVVNSKELHPQKAPLSHVHRFYAQWRINHGLESKYLLR